MGVIKSITNGILWDYDKVYNCFESFGIRPCVCDRKVRCQLLNGYLALQQLGEGNTASERRLLCHDKKASPEINSVSNTSIIQRRWKSYGATFPSIHREWKDPGFTTCLGQQIYMYISGCDDCSQGWPWGIIFRYSCFLYPPASTPFLNI